MSEDENEHGAPQAPPGNEGGNGSSQVDVDTEPSESPSEGGRNDDTSVSGPQPGTPPTEPVDISDTIGDDGGKASTPDKPSMESAAESHPQTDTASIDPRGVVVRIGRSVDGLRSEERFFLPSVTDLNQLNIGVVGDLGTGKTQLVKSLVYQIRNAALANHNVAPRFLIFDYKRDYQSDDFVQAVGAKVVEPYQLPLNLFDTSGVTRKPAWMPRFQFFADVLDKIYSNIGPKQRSNLSRAVKEAHEAAARMGRAATIYDVERQYEVIVGGNIDAPLSIIKDMTMSELFTHEPLPASSFEQFFDGVVVVSLADLGQDDRTKNLVVAVFLNMFYEFMLRLPKRKYRGENPQLRTIDSYLLVDEADNIMKYEFDVLKTILLQGREFGVGVLLASQYLRHFKVGATDYREPLLTWFIHKVPDIKPQELAALGLNKDLAHLTERIKQLPKHHCLYKTADIPGVFVDGLPFYRLMEDMPGL
ncbi:MAG: hypothetical protein U0841_35345 [Chloroflexia bacterium]